MKGADVEDSNDVEINDKRQRHQRKMAYISLYFILALVSFIILSIVFDQSGKIVERISSIETLLSTLILSCFGLTGSFMGIKTVMDIRNKR